MFISPAGGGGVQSFCANLAAALLVRGHHIDILLERMKGQVGDFPELPGAIRVVEWRVEQSANRYSLIRRLARFIAKGHYDAVYLNTSYIAYPAIALLGAERPAAIGACHALEHDLQLNKTYSDFLDHIFVLSSHAERIIRSELGDCSVGLSLVAHTVAHRRPTAKEFSKPLSILFAGRLIAEKRVADIFECVEQLSRARVNFILTIAGDGPCRVELERRLSRMSARDKIHLVGWQDAKQIENLFVAAHVTLLVSEAEGFGLTTVEGMSFGCVPVITNTCGCKGLVQDGTNGFVVGVGDIERIAGILRELDADRDRLYRMSVSARNTANSTSTLTDMTDRHLSIIDQAREHHRLHVRKTKKWRYAPRSRLDRAWIPDVCVRAIRRWTGCKSCHPAREGILPISQRGAAKPSG